MLAGTCHAEVVSNKVVPQSQAQLQFSFAPVVKQVSSAVVNIYTSRSTQTQNLSPLMDDPIFRHFFGEEMLANPSRKRIQRSLGSGVIVREDGIVITNNHVIRGADEIKVVLADGREFAAKAVVRESRTDLAALQLQGDLGSLPVLPIGDADQLEVGDVVLAIGNPFGLEQTVTSGVVSALARTQIGVSDLRSFIQTDASINRGNSGGALVDLQGQLVGINTVILSRTGGSIGIGFAIPANLVTPVILSVDNKGNIVRPWLGAAGQKLTAEIAQSLNLDQLSGVVITGMYPGSPAEQAGFKVGDVILEVDGYRVRDKAGLDFRVASRPVNHQAKIKLWRKKSKQTEVVTVKLTAPPGSFTISPATIDGRHPLVGAELVTLTPAVATKLGLDFMQKGVVVTKIKRGSIANRISLLPGDIIRRVNGDVTDSVANLERAIKKQPRWVIELQRGKRVFKLSLKA